MNMRVLLTSAKTHSFVLKFAPTRVNENKRKSESVRILSVHSNEDLERSERRDSELFTLPLCD